MNQNFQNFKLEIWFISKKKVTSQNSKIAHIYLSWTKSVPSFSKIREPLKKASSRGGFWIKISKISNLQLDFFPKKRWRHKTRKFCTFIYVGYKCVKFKLNQTKKINKISNLRFDFFPIKKVKSQNSKIAHIYLSWT